VDPELDGARVLLCVTGGIAAYKAAALTSALVQRGAIVDVAMTAEAERFVAPLTFASLTARPVYTSLWDAPETIPHIRLVREAAVVLVAPATANTIAKMATGIADDIVGALLLASRVPVLVAPAMNAAMYEHPATQAHLQTLRDRGVTIVEPETGFLAERESGVGRLASEERLLDALAIALRRTQSLRGKRVAITAGPTYEAFDPARFVGNASTGAQGIALAHEALARGAEVTLILGPTALQPPSGARVVRVRTAREMLDAAMADAVGADIAIAAAAVADWRPAEYSPVKVKKTDADLSVRMTRNPDVLARLGDRKGSTFLVGFAAETNDHERSAREKMVRKHLDAIAVNDVSEGRGFGPGSNALTLLYGEHGRFDLGEADKATLAARLFDAIERLMEDA
jgi:phosphopantothenoylcysteine decarboxylase/phosphopantothenate--cysteine ligase